MQDDPLAVPFVVAVDSREQHPYEFRGLRGRANQGHRPLLVTVERCCLATGDYSIRGFESQVAVERKSLADLYATLGQHRRRFEAEHQRMARMERARVVIEAEWSEILGCPPPGSGLAPKSVIATARSWEIAYGVPWIAVPGRRFAELETFRFLEEFWRQKAGRRGKRAY